MKRIILFFALLTFICSTVNSQNIRYVRENGTGDGSTWENASGDIQLMINDITVSGGEVWIAEGTYYPQYKVAEQYHNGYPTTVRVKTFLLKNNIKLYGGFPATGNPTFNDRDWRNNVTVLSGDLGSGSECVAVVTVATETGTAVIDGFTITGAKPELQGGTYYIWNFNFNTSYGGGIHAMVRAPGNIKLQNNIITGNTAKMSGGGLYLFTSGGVNVDINNNVFSDNTASNGSGGGLTLSSYFADNMLGAYLNFTGNTVTGNRANNGAGINGNAYRGYIADNIISDNIANHRGAGINLYCGLEEITEICNNTIFNNQSNDGAGMDISNSGDIKIMNNNVHNNRSTNTGSGIYLQSSRYSEIKNNNIYNNSSGSYGGGIYAVVSSYLTNSYIDITSNVFYENSAVTGGGGIYSTINNNSGNNGNINLTNNLLYDNSSGKGGGICAIVYGDTIQDKNNLNLTNNTLSGNVSNSNEGGGVYVNTTGVTNLNNCIVYVNTGTDVFHDNASPGLLNIQFSLVGTFENTSGIDDSQNHNIVGEDPLFISDDNFHLIPESPCINSGNPVFFNAGNNPDLSGINTDIEGNARIANSKIDMGAYQNTFIPDISLTGITVDGIDASLNNENDTLYEITIAYTGQIIIDATASEPTAIITGDTGPQNVNLGINDFFIELKSSDNTIIKHYKLEVTVLDNTGFSEITENESVLYPNPVKKIFYIESDSPVKEIAVYDIYGKQLKSINNSKSVDMEGYSNGIYFISVKYLNKEEIYKIIKSGN